jgi:hypothetical protein
LDTGFAAPQKEALQALVFKAPDHGLV